VPSVPSFSTITMYVLGAGLAPPSVVSRVSGVAALAFAYWFRLMTWNPNGVSTAPLDSPTASANAASLNGFAIFSRVNLPRLPCRSFAAGSSEYSATNALKSAPDFAFAATSSARFFASAFERVTPFGAFSAPLYATSTCCAAMASGTVDGADAEGAGGADAAADALAAALGAAPAGLGFGLSSHALVTAAIAKPTSTTDKPDLRRFSIGHAYYSSQDVGDPTVSTYRRAHVTEG
jgi:hypothetical protein